MARSWEEVFRLDGSADAGAGADPERGESQGFLSRLRAGLAKTRAALGLTALWSRPVDDATWEQLEEALIMADVGPGATAELLKGLGSEARAGRLKDGEQLHEMLRDRLAALADPGERGSIDLTHAPSVILVVGVNGTGKTTTIGKLAWQLRHQAGRSVILAAADTFRAAAVEQLEQWAERAEADIVRAAPGADPGAVVFDAIDAAAARGHDVVIADTAGRLHTQSNLMEELAKVRRVIAKRLPGAPHETLLVVDATTGQNGLRQAELFRESVDVTGVALTKLDGTAKGGIAVAISSELELPVKLIGVGESLEDLRPFDAHDYASALLD